MCECVCDVWSPGATNGAGESQDHYVEAVRALETLLSVSVSLSPSTLLPIPPSRPDRDHKDTSVEAMKTGHRQGRSDVREGWGLAERAHTHLSKSRKNKEALSTSFTNTHMGARTHEKQL